MGTIVATNTTQTLKCTMLATPVFSIYKPVTIDNTGIAEYT